MSRTVVPTGASSYLCEIQKALSPIETTMLGRTRSSDGGPSENAFSPAFASVISPNYAFSNAIVLCILLCVAITISKHASGGTLVSLHTLYATLY